MAVRIKPARSPQEAELTGFNREEEWAYVAAPSGAHLHVHQVPVSVGVLLLDLRRDNGWVRDASCVGTRRTRNHVMGKPEGRKEKKEYSRAATAAKARWHLQQSTHCYWQFHTGELSVY